MRFRNHPSIKLINENVRRSIFSFCEVQKDEIENESSESSISNEYEPEDVISDEDINQEQEEELLDIPTFLRRQAN